MLTEKIDQDIAVAMKAGQSDLVGVLRLLKTSLKNESIKVGHDLSDDEAMNVLVREAKQRRDSITAYNDAGRPELAKTEQDELNIIQEYLPKQLSEDEVKEMIDQMLTMGANGAQMGQIIGAVKAKAGASADGALIARLVQERFR